MLAIKEALKLTDLQLIDNEIKARRDLISVMVGWLYPQILTGEIVQLTQLKKEILYGKV